MAVIVELLMDPDLSVIPTTFQLVAEGVQSGTRRANKAVLQNMYEYAEQTFAASIERPRHSKTRGGTVYRPDTRATGRFTFGSGKTFVGTIIDNGPVQGVAFPDTDRAEQITGGAWRALEFGVTSMQMPVGFWRSGGKRVPGRQGGDDELVPTGRGTVEVNGIEAKEFLATAAERGRGDLERAYEELATRVARSAATHQVPGYFRNVTRTVYVEQRVSGYTTKSGRSVQSYIRSIPKTIVEQVWVGGYARR